MRISSHSDAAALPRVSILSPTYNHERFISECVESVLAQTESSWEMIVLDDGSTDRTSELLGRFDDPRVKIVRQQNRGILRLAETYNDGLAMCRAPIIAILEGDDYWPPDKLERMLPAFDNPEVVLAYGRTSVVSSGQTVFPHSIPTRRFFRKTAPGMLTNSPIGEAAKGMLDPRWLTFMYPCSVLIRRAALDRVGGFQARPGLPLTDYPTFLALTVEGRFDFTDRITGYWRVHPAGTTVNQRETILRCVEEEARRFRDANRHRLPISDASWKEIDRQWGFIRGYLATREGRRLLVRGEWEKAREHFVRALRLGAWWTQGFAIVGLMSSLARVPMEWIFRLAGRPRYRLSEDGQLQVDV
jgi:glycosyltransferase involved in cell wall biosynthesis